MEAVDGDAAAAAIPWLNVTLDVFDERDRDALPPLDLNDVMPQPHPDLDFDGIIAGAFPAYDHPWALPLEPPTEPVWLPSENRLGRRPRWEGQTHVSQQWRSWRRTLPHRVHGAIPLMWVELSSNTHVPPVYDRSPQWKVQPLAPDALPNPVPGSDFAIAQATGFLALPPTYLTADVTAGSLNAFRMVFEVSESLRAQRGVDGGLTATLVALVCGGRHNGPLVRGALLRAVSDGDVGVVRAFLDSNGDVNTGYSMVEDDEGRPNLSGWSLLHG